MTTLAANAPLIGILLLAGSGGSFSMEPALPIDWHGHTRVELPLSRDVNGMPTIPVQIMGRTVMAIVDTGSNASVISPALVANESAGVRGSTQMKGKQYETLNNVSVELGAVSVTLPAVVIADLPSDVPLLLGTEMFLHSVVEMDIDGGTLTLIQLGAFTPPDGYPIPLRLMKSVPTIQIEVNDQKHPICAVIDSGFNSGLALTKTAISELGLLKEGGRSLNSNGVGGEQTLSPVLTPLAVRIGPHLFRNVPASEQPGKATCDNLLGVALLAEHRLLLDLQLRRAWLLPGEVTE